MEAPGSSHLPPPPYLLVASAATNKRLEIGTCCSSCADPLTIIQGPSLRETAAAWCPRASARDQPASHLAEIRCVFRPVARRVSMPPLVPPAEQKRQRQEVRAAGAAVAPREALAQRSASFHGRGAAEQQRQHHHLLRQKPRTQPDLLAGVRGQGVRRTGADANVPSAAGTARKAAPSKVLVAVAVQRSMWPLHVMARTEWRVADLVAAAVELYVKEGRRPLLPSADPSAFSLHYSQFSLQRLDPEEKLMELGSRSFFLCSKAAAPADASLNCSSAETDKATAGPAKRPNMQVPLLGLMMFWPLL